MAYSITYSSRFQRAYKKLTETEKKQVKEKVLILSENPLHPSLRTKAFREQQTFLNVVLIWILGLSGIRMVILY